MGELDPTHAPRIGDAERERVAEVLRQAAGDGRISLDELDTRLEATYAARTEADLVPVTADLAHRGTSLPVPADQKLTAVLGGANRTGVWTVPAQLSVTAVLGGANIDLREAQFRTREVVIDVRAIMGGCEITVNPQTEVIVEGSGIMGGFSIQPGNAKPEIGSDSPVVRIRGVAFWGGVAIYRKRVKSERAR